MTGYGKRELEVDRERFVQSDPKFWRRLGVFRVLGQRADVTSPGCIASVGSACGRDVTWVYFACWPSVWA